VKFYFSWLVQKVIRISHNKYVDLLDESDDSRTIYCFPVYITVVFTILMTILQWITLAIIGVRIYADNFVIDPPRTAPNTGSYSSSGS